MSGTNCLQPVCLEESETKKVQSGLVNFFREGYLLNVAKAEQASDETILEYINSILQTYQIKITGGFLLKQLGLFDGDSASTSIDIDICYPYVRMNTAQEKKDHILRIRKLFQELLNVPPQNRICYFVKYFKGDTASMDLREMEAATTPIQFIQRFDFSFCRNWYDGKNVWVMDKEAVYKRTPCVLTPYDTFLFKKKNPGRFQRIAKYLDRGYRFQYKDPDTGDLVEITKKNLF